MTKLSHSEDASMTADTIHTCSYSCERPGCIRAQRDELVAKVEALRAEVERLHRILGRIVEGDGDSNLTIRAGADAFAAAREYLLLRHSLQ